MKIENLNQISEQINIQDSATMVDLKVIQNNHDLTDFKGVWNVTQNHLANVVSKNYRIIQHADVMQGLVETLSRLNIDVQGLLKSYNDTLRLDLIFQDSNKIVVKDDAEGIMLGIRVLNSYNKSTSFRLEMYGYRLICKNGMALGKALNQIKEVTFHMGKEKTTDMISEIIERFINDVINSSDKLKAYVDSCIADSIEWQALLNILPQLIKIKKHRTEIENSLKIDFGEISVSRWEFYNAITNYVSHGAQIKPTVETYLQGIAQKVLTAKSSGLLETFAPPIEVI